MQEREHFLPVPFSRREVNDRLHRGEHHQLVGTVKLGRVRLPAGGEAATEPA